MSDFLRSYDERNEERIDQSMIDKYFDTCPRCDIKPIVKRYYYENNVKRYTVYCNQCGLFFDRYYDGGGVHTKDVANAFNQKMRYLRKRIKMNSSYIKLTNFLELLNDAQIFLDISGVDRDDLAIKLMEDIPWCEISKMENSKYIAIYEYELHGFSDYRVIEACMDDYGYHVAKLHFIDNEWYMDFVD